MTHPALFSVSDTIDALSAAIDGDGLSILQRQALCDLRSDLENADDIDTVQDVIELANKQAKRGYY